MNEEQYWESSDYKLFWAYREKHLIKIRLDSQSQRDIVNFGSWLNGVYIGAIVGDMFGGSKNFPDSPIDWNEIEQENLRLKQMSEEERRKEKIELLEQQSRLRKIEIMSTLKRKEGV